MSDRYDKLKGNKNHVFSKYKNNAKRTNRNFLLTKDIFFTLIHSPCKYCGEIKLPFNGIDRIDNIKGYETDNCVPCCYPCNRLKGFMGDKTFIEQCKKISKNNLESHV